VPLPLCAYPENIYAIRYTLYAVRLCLPAGKHAGILTHFQTKVKIKMTKILLFCHGENILILGCYQRFD